MPQAAGAKGKEPLAPNPDAPTDTGIPSTKTRQVTKRTGTKKRNKPVKIVQARLVRFLLMSIRPVLRHTAMDTERERQKID